MPEYLSILRDASVASIYALFLLVLFLLILKGKIKEQSFIILYYFWLPCAVFTQFLMTYFRTTLSLSNLPVMNIYLMFELAIITYVLLLVRQKAKGIQLNYKIWALIILFGVSLHFLDDLDKIHNSAMLFLSIIYFQLTVSFIDLNKMENFIKDPYSWLNITVFIKAFGYSYFLIYQTDYKFPLIIFSGLNLLVQIFFGVTILLYYKSLKSIK